MLLSIKYLHSEGVVHKDLKLENFLYDQKGGNYLKLIDFGFSRIIHDAFNDRHQSCGTIFYVAPEVLERSFLSSSCDMWSLGVIVFVLVAGYMPFNGASDADIVYAIRHGRFNMHPSRWSHISEEAKDFVKRLLVVAPCDRMTAEQAMRHPWLRGQGSSSLRAPACSTASDAASNVDRAFLSFARATRFQQACMQMMAWTLPLQERRLLRDTFLEMDTSHSGVLRLDQLDQLLGEKYGMPELNRQVICKAMAVLDVDQDGELHYSDFLAVMMARRLKKRDFATIEEAFERFDTEGLGYLTETGLRQTLHEDVDQSEIQQTFRLLDVDQDGRIYLNDFVAHLCEAVAPTSSETASGMTTKKACVPLA